jgi:HK97 family phage major capsid protein
MPSQVIEKMNADLAALLTEVKPLAEKSKQGTLSAEEDQRFGELATQIQNQREQMDAQAKRESSANEILDLDQHYNKPADSTKRGVVNLDTATEPGATKRVKGIGRQFVNSEEYKQYLTVKRGGSRPIKVGGMFPEADRSADLDGQKALIYSGTGSASMLLPQVLPGIYRGAEAPLVMRDVLMNLNTTSDNVTVIQESGFTNNAAEVAEATLVSEGAKPESALTFTEATFPVRTIAHWVPITRQMLEDLAFMEGYVEQRLRIGLLRREDNQFINGNGTPPNLTGILATSGIQTLDAAYFTGADVINTGTDNQNIDRIRRAKRVIQVTGDALATFMVINPTDKEAFDTITDANRQYLLGGPMNQFPNRMWSLQVVESENIAAGTVLVGDGTAAAVVDRRDAQIYMTDSHSDYFIRNILVILAEERVALAVFRPGSFAKVTLATW